MSDFMDMLVEMLPMHSSLQNEVNPVRQVLDKSMGEYMEAFEQPFDQLFLESASGGWLDAIGKDYGIPRKLDESDEDYRQRIIYEKKDNLTIGLLYDIYNVELFNAYDGFNPKENDLTSDNPYISDFLFGVADTETQEILNKKFIMDNSVLWYNNDGLDYIFNTSDVGGLRKFLKVYNLREGNGLFKHKTSIKSVKLTLPNLDIFTDGFYGCTGLTDVILDLPNIVSCQNLFYQCSNLKTAKLILGKLPNAYEFKDMLYGTQLEKLDVTIPENIVDVFEGYLWSDPSLTQYMDTLIINGEEVEL